MAHAQSEQKSIRISFRQRLLPRRHRDRIARVDIRDACGDHHSFGACQQQASVHQRFTPQRFSEPERAIPQFLQLARALLSLGRRLVLELTRPDSDPPKLYRILRQFIVLPLSLPNDCIVFLSSLLRSDG